MITDEADMVNLVEDHFVKKGFLAKREVDVGSGRADLVLLRPRGLPVPFAWPPLDDPKFFYVLEAIPWRSKAPAIEAQALALQLGFSWRYLSSRYLGPLLQRGLVRQDDKGRFLRRRNGSWAGWALTAIEVKVRKWRRAAQQANRYSTFAHRSFVAVNEEVVKSVDRALLQEHGLGLMSVNGNVRVVFGAALRSPRNHHSHHAAVEACLFA